jgi:PAS domain S-box-containing protein
VVGTWTEIEEYKRAKRGMHELVAIVESSEDAIIGKTLDGIVTSWNRGAERLLGYGAEEVIGQPITRFIPPDRLDEETQIRTRLRGGERVEHFETIRRRKDGTLVDVSLSISPIREGSGFLVGAAKIARDTTERNRAEATNREAHERLREQSAVLDLACLRAGAGCEHSVS